MASEPLPPADRIAVDPTGEQLAVLGGLDPDAPVVMLNLLRFREEADYSAHPDLAPEKTITGAEAYQRYGDAVQDHLARAGGAMEYLAPCGPTVIGPPGERWDTIVLVRYPNPGAFLAMVTNPAYQAITGHRTAALADSRLVPTTP